MSAYDSPELESQMQHFFLDAVRLSQKATEKVDGTASRRDRAALVDLLIKYAKEETLPRLNKRSLKLYSEGRASRSFESELNRLWEKASNEYQKISALETIENLPSIVSEQILSDDPDYARRGFEYAASIELKSITIPVLEAHPTPGDDLLLYFLDTMCNPDEKSITDHIADSLLAPPQMLYAFLGIFGLLIQAKRSGISGNLAEAYSYLMDANHMIGMLEASAWLTTRFDKIAASRNGKLNARKDTKRKVAVRQAKSFVEHLFYNLMPSNSAGYREWKNHEKALTEINAHICDNNINLGISDHLIKQECLRLHNLDKKIKHNNKFRFQANYVFIKKDGTKINIPIPLDD